MNTEKLKSTVRNIKKGTFCSVRIVRPVKTKKAYADERIIKVSSVVLRSGIDYDKMASVIAKRETGELPSENQGLPWGEWLEHPFFITHKGTLYVRFSLIQEKRDDDGNSYKVQKGKIKTRYYRNGVRVSKSSLADICLASEFSSKRPDCITVKAENIAKISCGRSFYVA